MDVHEFHGVLGAAQAGADWAWSRIYDAYASRLLGYLRSRGGVDADALLGDVLLQVARNIGTFEGGEPQFRSWLFLIAHNRVIDERRRRRRKPEHELEFGDHPVVESAESTALTNLSIDGALALLEDLTDDQREVIALRIIAGLSLAETAEVMDKNTNAVKQLQHRAISALRGKLDATVTPQPSVTVTETA